MGKHLCRYQCPLLRVLILILALCLTPLFTAADFGTPFQPDVADSELRGMLVHTGHGTDFPLSDDLTQQQLTDSLSNIVFFAKQNGLNAILFEAVCESEAFYSSNVYPASATLTGTQGETPPLDCLETLAELCKKEGIRLYALISPYKAAGAKEQNYLSEQNPAANRSLTYQTATGMRVFFPEDKTVLQNIKQAAQEILQDYDVEGIIFGDLLPEYVASRFDPESYITALVQTLTPVFDKTEKELGLWLSYSQQYARVFHNIDLTAVDLMFCTIPQTLDTSPSYTEVLGDLLMAVNTNTQLVTVNQASRIASPVSDGYFYRGRSELNLQLYINRSHGVQGFFVDDYSALKLNPFCIASNLSYDYSKAESQIPEGIDLSYPTELSITRPTEKITTSAQQYFITGLSNPKLPLYLDSQPIERQTQNGGFGVLVHLEIGENRFYFSQENKTVEVSIERTDPDASTEPEPIVSIVKGSAWPNIDDVVRQGESFTLSCTAPSGAQVTAEVASQKIQLSQVTEAQEGLPTVFSATLTADFEVMPEATINLGSVSYTLNYLEKLSVHHSNGDLYLAGSDANIAVQVNESLGNVLYDKNEPGEFYTTLKKGSVDYAELEDAQYFSLSSGGYIPKTQVDILTGVQDLSNLVSSIVFTADDRNEFLTFTGTNCAAFKAERDDEYLTLTLFHTQLEQEFSLDFQSSIFSSAEFVTDPDAESVTLRLRHSGKLWGYDVDYESTNTRLLLRKRPSLSTQYGMPLSGVVVTIDAGHGGADPGALGIAGTLGPTEKDLNFYSAYLTKLRLEQLGAKVYMTRSEDVNLTFDERMQPALNSKSDFYLSFHHNSMAETSDTNSTSGTMVFYHEPQSQAFAENLVDSLCGELNRKNLGAYQDYYRVTRMTYASSVLIELGFMPNPTEYEDLCTQISLFRTSDAVCQAIIRTLEPST